MYSDVFINTYYKELSNSPLLENVNTSKLRTFLQTYHDKNIHTDKLKQSNIIIDDIDKLIEQ